MLTVPNISILMKLTSLDTLVSMALSFWLNSSKAKTFAQLWSLGTRWDFVCKDKYHVSTVQSGAELHETQASGSDKVLLILDLSES